MKIQVTNLITGEKTLFVNDYSLSHNIVSLILIDSKRTGDLLNDNVRQSIAASYPIREGKSKLFNNPFAYCDEKNLHAKYID